MRSVFVIVLAWGGPACGPQLLKLLEGAVDCGINGSGRCADRFMGFMILIYAVYRVRTCLDKCLITLLHVVKW